MGTAANNKMASAKTSERLSISSSSEILRRCCKCSRRNQTLRSPPPRRESVVRRRANLKGPGQSRQDRYPCPSLSAGRHSARKKKSLSYTIDRETGFGYTKQYGYT